MLLNLLVENYILIEKVSVDFNEGFSVFTGETGAGKSLLIESLNFVSGARSNASIVAEYGDQALVQAVFDISDNERACQYLKENDLYEEDNLILSRSMNKSGRSIMKINGYNTNLSSSKELMSYILDIHSQHETQYLLSSKNHRYLLDQFILDKSNSHAYQKDFANYDALLKKKEALVTTVLDPEKMAFQAFLLEEINSVSVSLEEYEALSDRLSFLENFEKNKRLYTEIQNSLEKAQTELYLSQSSLEQLGDEKSLSTFNNIFYELEAFLDDFSQHRYDEEFDEQEFNSLNERMVSYHRLIRKYGDIDAVISKKEALETELEQLENHEQNLKEIDKEIEIALNKAMASAEKLSKQRHKEAKILEKRIEKELNDLLLVNAKFVIEISDDALKQSGKDKVVFKVSMNPGKKPEPLDTVASGGELSRLMLGLKVIFTQAMGISTVVFDEIDSGLSGSAGFAIGSKMKSLSQDAQVISITHLPSVAACANDHFEILKSVKSNKSQTSIQLLDKENRIKQLALMIDGQASSGTLKAAQELFSKGQG